VLAGRDKNALKNAVGRDDFGGLAVEGRLPAGVVDVAEDQQGITPGFDRNSQMARRMVGNLGG
jgi:hypothetical protein